MTTGTFYVFYKSKEKLLKDLASEHYAYLPDCFQKAQKKFADLPHKQQTEVLNNISGAYMFDLRGFIPSMSIWKNLNLFIVVRKGQHFLVSLIKW